MADGVMTGATRVVQGKRDRVLDDLRRDDVAAAIWQRERDASFASWIDSLAASQLPEQRVTCPVERAHEAAQAACDVAGMAQGMGRDMLCDDIAVLTQCFARVMQISAVRLRLDVVRDDACRKFHLDRVPARLLCTYRGKGMEYGEARHDRPPEEISHMQPGDAGIFRGATWPGMLPSGVVHRSPPMVAGDAARLLLVLDAALPDEV
jgi:hypothetical protein